MAPIAIIEDSSNSATRERGDRERAVPHVRTIFLAWPAPANARFSCRQPSTFCPVRIQNSVLARARRAATIVLSHRPRHGGDLPFSDAGSIPPVGIACRAATRHVRNSSSYGLRSACWNPRNSPSGWTMFEVPSSRWRDPAGNGAAGGSLRVGHGELLQQPRDRALEGVRRTRGRPSWVSPGVDSRRRLRDPVGRLSWLLTDWT